MREALEIKKGKCSEKKLLKGGERTIVKINTWTRLFAKILENEMQMLCKDLTSNFTVCLS